MKIIAFVNVGESTFRATYIILEDDFGSFHLLKSTFNTRFDKLSFIYIKDKPLLDELLGVIGEMLRRGLNNSFSLGGKIYFFQDTFGVHNFLRYNSKEEVFLP